MSDEGRSYSRLLPWSWRKRALWGVAFGVGFLLPYAQLGWWGFAPSTLVLLALLFWRYGAETPTRGGLSRRPSAWLASLVTLAALWALFRFVLVARIAEQRGLTLDPWPIERVLPFAFQTLNEEIVLGALLLFALARRWPRPRLVAVLVAVVFSVLHALLYRYGTLDRSLESMTLASLIAVGVVRNSAILLAGHIGYAWALHTAWNFVMFSGTWRSAGTGSPLVESQVLDALVGHPWVLVPTALAAGVLLALLRRRHCALGV